MKKKPAAPLLPPRRSVWEFSQDFSRSQQNERSNQNSTADGSERLNLRQQVRALMTEPNRLNPTESTNERRPFCRVPKKDVETQPARSRRKRNDVIENGKERTYVNNEIQPVIQTPSNVGNKASQAATIRTERNDVEKSKRTRTVFERALDDDEIQPVRQNPPNNANEIQNRRPFELSQNETDNN